MTTTALPRPRTSSAPLSAAPARRAHRLLVAAVALVALTGGLVAGRAADDGIVRVDDAVDIGFARDMKVHHAQAVAMSAHVHRRSEDPELSFLALDIITTQQGQIGIMSGWLDLWGHTQSKVGAAMTWMGDEHAGSMPGMATDEEVAALGTLPVPQMEEQYLRLMIRHHWGAVPMAEHAAEEASSPEVSRLAKGMEQGQTAEVDLMQHMLAARGLAPEHPQHAGHAQHG